MRVFLSWSGSRSRQVARALSPWIRTVLPKITTWMSDVDLPPGGRWSVSLQEALRDSDFGILCVTPGNVDSAWLLFEGGAISNTSKKALVAPLLIDLRPEDLPPPLRQFQAVTADEDGLYKLCRVLNSKVTKQDQFDESVLHERFVISFPSLRESLAEPYDRLEILQMGIHFTQVPPIGCGLGTSPPSRTR
jgi:hypothetical protein